MPTALLVTSDWPFNLWITWLHQQSHHNLLESFCFSASTFFVWMAKNLAAYSSREAESSSEPPHRPPTWPGSMVNWVTGAQSPPAPHSWSLPLWYVPALAPSWCHVSCSWSWFQNECSSADHSPNLCIQTLTYNLPLARKQTLEYLPPNGPP